MAEKKITKREYFVELKGIVETAQPEGMEDLVAFIDKMIEQIDNKASKAKAKAAEKKSGGDELRAVIQGMLTDEFQTGEEIAEGIEGEDVTKAKVIARLTQLVKAGIAEKDTVKVGDRRLTAYRLASEVDTEE